MESTSSVRSGTDPLSLAASEENQVLEQVQDLEKVRAENEELQLQLEDVRKEKAELEKKAAEAAVPNIGTQFFNAKVGKSLRTLKARSQQEVTNLAALSQDSSGSFGMCNLPLVFGKER